MDKYEIINELNAVYDELDRLKNWQAELLGNLQNIRSAVQALPEHKPDNSIPYLRARFLVVENYHPNVKINMIKVVRELTGLGLREAKEVIEGVFPIIIEAPNDSTMTRQSAQNSLLTMQESVKFCWR